MARADEVLQAALGRRAEVDRFALLGVLGRRCGVALVQEAAQGVDRVRPGEQPSPARKLADLGRGGLAAHGPAVPHRVALAVRSVDLERVVDEVQDDDDRTGVALREQLAGDRQVLLRAVGRHAGVEHRAAAAGGESGRKGLAVLDAEPEHLRVADDDDLVLGGRRPIVAAVAAAVDVDRRQRVLAQLKAHRRPGLEADAELGIGDVEVGVREGPVVAPPEGELADHRAEAETDDHLRCDLQSAAPSRVPPARLFLFGCPGHRAPLGPPSLVRVV
jgi:hypothetical protein